MYGQPKIIHAIHGQLEMIYSVVFLLKNIFGFLKIIFAIHGW
jgi:hypothetical protein